MSNQIPSVANDREWLKENPHETVACAARIFKLNPITLRSAIERNPTGV